MTFSPDELVFRARALAQTHPFSPRAQAYLRATVAREQEQQHAVEIGTWAGHALTAGYCLRRVEETDADGALERREDLPGDLEELSSEIADRIRTERADDLLLYPEPLVVDALDHLIAGEVERRLSHGSDSIDQETFSQLESYLAWWTIKGYALRVAEQVMSEEVKEGSSS